LWGGKDHPWDYGSGRELRVNITGKQLAQNRILSTENGSGEANRSQRKNPGQDGSREKISLLNGRG